VLEDAAMSIERPPERPGVTIVPIHGKTPQIHESAFIAPGCRIIGDVTIGAGSSVWYNCVLRADVSRIVIGQRSNVQDGSVLHCDPPRPGDPDGSPLIIGDDVLIGHMAMVHGCTIHDRGFVGLGAIAMNKAVIASDAMLAAGAMLTEGKVMRERELWGGRPARKMRDLDDAAVMGMRMGTAHYAQNAQAHAVAVDVAGIDAAGVDVPATR
jgi:carbonic anhydrase/acetyltransferase-like protein (isoleucine patch superfamily)